LLRNIANLLQGEFRHFRFWERKTIKAPRGKSESLWSLHIRSFWKFLLVLMALSKRLGDNVHDIVDSFSVQDIVDKSSLTFE